MRIFLTGGRGMVGRNFTEHAAAAGHEILAPTSVELDLLNAHAVSAWVQQHQPEVVVHAAGRVGGIQANMRDPVAFLTENLDMGRNVVMAARQAGVKRLLNLGSSCMYPRNAPNPLAEQTVLTGELEPTNEGYALAKIMVARLCDYIGREDASLQYRTLIPCNLYGRHDKFDPKHSHLVPAVIHKIHHAKVQGRDEVDIWGSGKVRREFMYAGDLADCMWRALEHFETLPAYLNVGLGKDLSILDYYHAVARIVGFDGKFVHDLSKPEGMAQKLVDTSRLEAWGWRATTALESGIAQTYQFYLEGLQA
ncbi:nodulation protein NolK [Herbaspirillum rubrisubalbicans]|uniref:GDP-L-fucose synthase n=1 Tax=Herbaspirillum rubrisubalbicans TaxID=80842 RepID=A0ABX9BV96_9BURK|nr:GDP-L-fucose synthase [Herbaspirillum rubrisubalbicans]RAM61660.1 nodulation protein NolK [Herbaspirillum rubrisubalbicans]RAN44044.1 nodulation protein NolK [Herbaspirillum rubrisubalbicans]